MILPGDSATPVTIHIARWAVTAFVALVGLLAGSFLNVVIYRVPRRLSVASPRSFCPHCDTPVRPVDNVPVLSWLMLRGRCHHCRGPISVRYPLVESATAATFAAVGWGLGPHWAVAGFCVLAATFIALVAIEADGLAPPVSVAAIGTGLAAVLLLAAGIADRRWPHVIGLGVGVVVAVVLVVVASGRSSSGPVLLPVGAVLGWLGPGYAAVGLATAGAVMAVERLTRRGRTQPAATDRVVTGLALATGAVVATVVAVGLGAGVGR